MEMTGGFSAQNRSGITLTEVLIVVELGNSLLLHDFHLHELVGLGRVEVFMTPAGRGVKLTIKVVAELNWYQDGQWNVIVDTEEKIALLKGRWDLISEAAPKWDCYHSLTMTCHARRLYSAAMNMNCMSAPDGYVDKILEISMIAHPSRFWDCVLNDPKRVFSYCFPQE